MIWLNPAALIAVIVVAAPILVHILVQRRAERFAFPTLRFLRPTRLTAIRRHVLEDVLLLAVRVAILSAAVVALAGPLMVTSARRQLWQERLVRATVVGAGVPEGARAFPAFAGETAAPATARLAEAPEAPERQTSRTAPSQPFRSEHFSTVSLSDGISRAVAWLETAPPARRELVIVAPFAIGSIAAADLARVPGDVGIRFDRSGTLPQARTIPFGRLLTSGGALDREVTLTGAATIVRDVSITSGTRQPEEWPIEILSSPAARPAADAAVTAVLAKRVWAPAPDRRAQLVLLDTGAIPTDPGIAKTVVSVISTVAPIRVAWMADAVAGIARDADLQAAARRVPSGAFDARLSGVPWQRVADAANGDPLVSAARSGSRLVVVSAAPVSSVMTPILMRAMANALAAIPDLQSAEVVPIPGTLLREWSRPAVPLPAPRLYTVDQDDRRWLWIAALALLAIETWIRRVKPRDAAAEDDERMSRRGGRRAREREAARVA